MPPPDQPRDSTDPNTLAAQAADEGQSRDARRIAFEGLADLIRDLAMSLSVRLTGRVRDELTDAAAGEVYLRIQHYKPDGSFAAWCHRTLHNWMVDKLRADTRRSEREQAAARLRPEATLADPPAETLSVRDVNILDGCHPGQRLALLCLMGLWREIPKDVWRHWCEAYAPGGEQLPAEFPPVEFEKCSDQQERADILAELLRVRRGTLAVWVHRCAARWREQRGE